MFRKTLLTVLAIAACAATLSAQRKPNFSGTWKLNSSKSDFGVIPGPDTRTDKIEQTDSAIKEDVDAKGGPQGDQAYTLTFALDGSETTASVAPGIDVKNTAKWDGGGLATDSKLSVQGQEIGIKSTWTLSDDGKTLTMAGHVSSGLGDFDQKLVFDKQEGGAGTAAAPSASAFTGAGGKPNLSGTWKLIVEKSDFGVMPPPTSETDVVDHQEPRVTLKVTADTAQGKGEYTITSTTDGKEAVNRMMGQEVKTTTTWEGNNLVANLQLSLQGNDVTMKRVYVLSADGKTLTVNSHLASAMGEMDQKMIYEKQ